MLQRLFLFSLIYLMRPSFAWSQLGLEVSTRYDAKTDLRADEYLPQFFVTILPYSSKSFSVNAEIFYDYDRSKRRWPAVGMYTITSQEFGGGLQFRLDLLEESPWKLQILTGVGIKMKTYSLQTRSKEVRDFILVPTGYSKLYSYAMLVGGYALTDRSEIKIGGGLWVKPFFY
jgi:hypothetical protein